MKRFVLMFVICLFFLGIGGFGYAQSVDTASDKILGIDTSTFFTALESIAKNAIQSWNGIVIDKDGDVSYQNAYDIWEGKGLLGSKDSTGQKSVIAPAVGVITDWHKAGGIHAGINLFKKSSDMESKFHVNIKIAGFFEGTTDSAKDNWNTGGFIAGRISLK